MAPSHRPPAATVYIAAGCVAGCAYGLVHVILPAAVDALEAAGLPPPRWARSITATAPPQQCAGDATHAEGGAGHHGGRHDTLVSTLAHWLVAKRNAAADALLGSSGSGFGKGGAAAAPATASPSPPDHRHHPLLRAVHPPPSRLGRIAVGLPASSPAVVHHTTVVGGGPGTPGSARAGTPVRVPASTDSELVSALRAKLAGEDPPPATPPSARAAAEECVPANYTGARPPRYVSPRSASADGQAVHGAFAAG
jgi:hypothetical protein